MQSAACVTAHLFIRKNGQAKLKVLPAIKRFLRALTVETKLFVDYALVFIVTIAIFKWNWVKGSVWSSTKIPVNTRSYGEVYTVTTCYANQK
jgi:hypothetical protein